MKGCFFLKVFLVICQFLLFVPLSAAAGYQIGVYYYPGWSPYIKGPQEPDPWSAIKPYADREPALGWYADGKVSTLEQQLEWMAAHGIGFVTFDWYWENAKPAPESSVRAYLNSSARAKVKYALLWANHNKAPQSLDEWDSLVDYWLGRHLKNPEYLKVDGKPVMFIFSGEVLTKQAQVIGLSVAQMLERARSRAARAGLNGIYFVICVAATDYWVQRFAPSAGFDAMTAYNYHFSVAGDANLRSADSHSYVQLDAGYRVQWDWILRNGSLPYFIPMTSGWDKRPWGGSKDPLHDNSISTPDSFRNHLLAARALMDKYPAKTKRIGMICCWNEYGEGSYMEPTKNWGTQYLEQVNTVFGRPAAAKAMQR